MRVLVIGGTGQLARALALARAEDSELTFLGRDACDLADPRGIVSALAQHRPDVVVNAAAYTAVDRAETEHALAFRINATAVGAIARACAANGAALVHVSTDYVFDGASPRPYRETDPTGPLNTYGASKLAGEQAAWEGCARTVILRTSWVVSPWGRNFLTTMLKLATTRPRIQVVADQTGKPTSALDLAGACLAAARAAAGQPAAARVWGLYHYAGADVCTWADFAEAILTASNLRFGSPLPVVERVGTDAYPTIARRPENSVLDCGKFETAFSHRCIPWRAATDAILTQIAAEAAEQDGAAH